jgi:sugar phosphate isomerase/epimerase
MRLGVFARTFPGASPDHVLGRAAAAGYEGVHYNMACSGLPSLPEEIPDTVVAALRAAVASTRMALYGVSATYNMIHPDPVVRARGRESLRVIASRAGSMGIGLVTLCSGTCDPNDQWRYHPGNDEAPAWRTLLQEMTAAIQIAEDADVDLGLEPELANVVSSPERAHLLIETLKSDRVRVVLDPANLFERESLARQREIAARAIDLLADRIVMAHAKDRLPDGRFAAAGHGVLDYRHYLRQLRAIGFAGPLVVHGLTDVEAPEARQFLTNVLSELDLQESSS